MKKQWIMLVVLIIMVSALLSGAYAEQADVLPRSGEGAASSVLAPEAPTNVQVSATMVGRPFTVTWDGPEETMPHHLCVYAANGDVVYETNIYEESKMFYTVFRQMPGTYTVGMSSYTWDEDGTNIYSTEAVSQPFTVAASGKTWDYVIANGEAKIAAYYGSDTNVSIPATLGGYPVTEILANAFEARKITSVTLPDTVTEIKTNAFANSSLRSITIGAHVRVHREAFLNCSEKLVVTGYTGSDAEAAVCEAGGSFVSCGTLQAAPKVTKDPKYNEFTVSDPDAECYEYKIEYSYEQGDGWENELLKIMTPGESRYFTPWVRENALSQNLFFRVFKNGAWSAWSEPWPMERENSGDSTLDFDSAVPLTERVMSLDVKGAKYSLIRIQPNKTETYTFTSEGERDTYAMLVDEFGGWIDEDDDGGEEMNFLLPAKLEAGKTYYLCVRFYGQGEQGSVNVLTDCSLFSTLPVPEVTVGVNTDGNYVVQISGANAESFRLKVKTILARWESDTDIKLLEAVNGAASYVLDNPAENNFYYEISASSVNGEDNSPWTEAIILKDVADGTLNGLQWKRNDDGEIVIVGYVGHEKHVVVPAAINGLPVTKIENRAFADSTGIITVVLPEGLRKIGEFAFEYCADLYMAKLPESLEYLGGYAFRNCNRLKVINIPAALRTVGDGVFQSCYDLEWVYLPFGSDWQIPDGMFDYCSEGLVIEGEAGGAAMGVAMSSGVSYSPSVETAEPELAPVVTVSGPLLSSGSTEIHFSMSGAEMFRMILTGDYVEDGGWEHLGTDTIKIEVGEDGEAVYTLRDYGYSRGYYVMASALVNGKWSPWSNQLVIKPTYLGKLAKPVPVIDDTITAGQPFHISWQSIENAVEYYVEVMSVDDEEYNWYSIYYGSDNDVDVVWSRPAGDYVLTVNAGGEMGWLSSRSVELNVHVERGESDFMYFETDEGITLNRFIGLNTAETIEIPSQIGGVPVVCLDNGLLARHPSVRSIVVPETVTEIFWGAFSNCQYLESIEFRGPVAINSSILQYCPNLTTITFANAGATVGTYCLESIHPNRELTIRGYTGTDIEEIAARFDYAFESIGKLPDCPEFTLEPDNPRESGVVQPGDTLLFTLNDPEAEQVLYRLAYTYLDQHQDNDHVVTQTRTAQNIDGVFTAHLSTDTNMSDVSVAARAYKNGLWTAWSEPHYVNYVTERMPKVTGVQASFVDGKAVVTWDAVEDAYEYRIFVTYRGETNDLYNCYAYSKENCFFYWTRETDEYDIYVVAERSLNGDKLRGICSDPVRVRLEKDTRDRYVDVSATEGIMGISPVIMTVYAKDADRIQIQRVDENGNESNEINTREERLSMQIGAKGTYLYVAYASWDDGETWEEIGRATVTITTLGEIGPVAMNVPLYVRQGEDLVFSFEAIENVTEYHLRVRDSNWNLLRSDDNVLPNKEIRIPAESISTESVNIEIWPNKLGYMSFTATREISVMPQTEHTDITVSVNKTEILIGEEINMTVDAPGATCVWLYRNGRADDYDYADSDGKFYFGYTTWNPGEEVLFVRAYYGDLENFEPNNRSLFDGPSEIVKVKVISLGDAPIPEVNIQTPTEDDPFIRAEIIPTGEADRYFIYLYEGNGQNTRQITSLQGVVDQENPMATLTVSYPVNLLRNGYTYTADIRSERHGYRPMQKTVEDFRYVRSGEEEERYFYVSSNTGTVDIQPVYALVHAEGADGLRLSYMSGEYSNVWSSNWADTLRAVISRAGNNEEYVAYATYDDGETWVEIGRETISITYIGRLENVKVNLPPYLRAGEDLVFSIEAVKNATAHYVRVLDTNWNELQREQLVNPGDTITIPASMIPEDGVIIDAWARTVGYDWQSATSRVQIMPPTEHTDVTLSLEKTEVLVGDQIYLTATAPGATCIMLYRNGRTYTYEYTDSEGAAHFDPYVWEPGEVIMFVRAYYGDMMGVNPYDMALYDGPSEVVKVNVISLGDAPIPEVNIQAPTEDDPFIRAEIIPTGVADYYTIQLYENGRSIEDLQCNVDQKNPMAMLTVSYPVELMRPGCTYTAEVRSERHGYTSMQKTLQNFCYVHPGEEEEQYFHVSSNTGVVDAAPVQMIAHADGANGIRISYVNGTYVNNWYSTWNDTLRTTMSDYCSNREFIAYATYDGGMTWVEIGRETISISYIGTLENVKINAPLYLREGEDLVFSIEAIANVDADYYLRMMDSNWNSLMEEQQVNPGENITVPASMIPEDGIRLQVRPYAIGYDCQSSTLLLPVMPQTEHTDVTLTVEKSELLVGEQIYLTATAPGATYIMLYRNGDTVSHTYTDSEGSAHFTLGTVDPGEEMLFVRAYYGELSNFDPYDMPLYDGPSEAVRVNVISLGDAPIPEVNIQAPTEEDPFVRTEIIPTGVADCYTIHLYDDNSHINGMRCVVDQENPMATLTVSYPATLLRNGHTYTALVSSERYGYVSTQEEVKNFRYVHPGEEEAQYFRVSTNKGVVDVEPVQMIAHADGANEMRIAYASGEYVYNWNYSSGDTIRTEVSRGCDNEEYIAYASYDNGMTWEEIGRQTISVRYLGTLDTPVIQINPYVVEGEDLVLSVNAVDHARRYSVWVRDNDTYEFVYSNTLTEFNKTITIPASKLTSKRYRVDVNVYGEGYQNNSTTQGVLVMPEPKHEIALSANRDSVESGKSVILTVDAPGAKYVWLYYNGSRYSSYWYDGKPLEIIFGIEKGMNTFFVQAYYGDTDGYFDIYDTEKYDGLSNSIQVTGYSYGEAALPIISMPTNVNPGDPINIVVTPNGFAEEYNVELYCAFDNNAGWGTGVYSWAVYPKEDNTPVTLTCPSDALIPGRQYSLYVAASAKGYDTNSRSLSDDDRYISINEREGVPPVMTLDRTTIQQGKEVWVLLYDPDATEMQITIDKQQPNSFGISNFVDGYCTVSVYLGSYLLGEHTLHAWVNKGGEWVQCAETKVTVVETNYLQVDDMTVPHMVRKGDMVTVKISPVKNAEGYSAQICDAVGHILEYVRSNKPEIQFNTEYLPHDGIYYVSVCANATEYTSMWSTDIPVLMLTNVQALKLPESMQTIEDEAFEGIAANYVVLPNTVTSIGSRAFADCTNLKAIVIPESVTSIADDAFNGCGELMIITTPGSTAYNRFNWTSGFIVAEYYGD